MSHISGVGQQTVPRDWLLSLSLFSGLPHAVAFYFIPEWSIQTSAHWHLAAEPPLPWNDPCWSQAIAPLDSLGAIPQASLRARLAQTLRKRGSPGSSRGALSSPSPWNAPPLNSTPHLPVLSTWLGCLKGLRQLISKRSVMVHNISWLPVDLMVPATDVISVLRGWASRSTSLVPRGCTRRSGFCFRSVGMFFSF